MNWEVETFDKIGYLSMGANFGYHLPYWYIPVRSKEMNFTLVPLAGLKMINRYNQEERQLKNGDWVYSNSSHYAFQVGGSLRFDLGEKFILDLTTYLSSRPDINYYWQTDKNFVLNTYLGLHYKIN